MRFSQTVFLTSVVTAVYLVAVAAVLWLLLPVQVYVASRALPFAEVTCLLALTHGVRVIATWLFRWRAILFLAPGAIVEAVVLGDHYALSAGDEAVLILAIASGCFIAFELFRALGWSVYADRARLANWRPVMLAGTLATLVNAAILVGLDFGGAMPGVSGWLPAYAVIGGIMGLFAWLLLLRVVLRRALQRIAAAL